MPVSTTTLSTKGQVVLPRELREARGWRSGTRLIVESTPDGLLLRAETAPQRTRLDDVVGMLGRVGPILTPEEEDAALREAFARDHAGR